MRRGWVYKRLPSTDSDERVFLETPVISFMKDEHVSKENTSLKNTLFVLRDSRLKISCSILKVQENNPYHYSFYIAFHVITIMNQVNLSKVAE